MGQTAENVATEHQISRGDQDPFASQPRRCKAAQESGFFDAEIIKVSVKKGKAEIVVDKDEHPRATPRWRRWASCRRVPRRRHGDGGQLLGHQRRRLRHDPRVGGGGQDVGLTPRARVVATATAGVPPRVMGIGPVPATRKLLASSA